jgi:hypothetical protein
VIQTLPQPPLTKQLAANETSSLVYYVAWRSRKNHPWRSEEFTSRFQAHCRYFALLDRGAEAYVENRQPTAF